MNHPHEHEDLRISEVKVRLATGDDEGVVAWASCVLNESILLNNIALRRGDDGELALRFPAKKSQRDVKYYHFNPITHEAHAVIERAILGALHDLVAGSSAFNDANRPRES